MSETWTLEMINNVWVLKAGIDREHDQHRIYGTDRALGETVRDALNSWEYGSRLRLTRAQQQDTGADAEGERLASLIDRDQT